MKAQNLSDLKGSALSVIFTRRTLIAQIRHSEPHRRRNKAVEVRKCTVGKDERGNIDL